MPKKKKIVKTILTDRGYAIVKEHFGFRDINRTKRELTVSPYVNENYAAKARPFPIYMESFKKIYLPKHYGFETFGDPDKVKAVTNGNDIEVEFKGQLREKQLAPMEAFMKSCEKGSLSLKSHGGIISLPCGYGKTILALKLISRLQKKTLVIVHKEFLINQWKERIEEFLPGARVGLIQASKVDIHNKDIVLGMLQSISMKEYPEDTFKSFGFTIIDECHHIAAEVFSRSLPKINSQYLLGLSATPKRKDGLSKVFNWFLGPMIYEIKIRDGIKVDVNVLEYNNKDESYCKQELTGYGKICMPRMINNICNYKRRTKIIIELIIRLRNKGKKILVLSNRRQHLTDIYEIANNRNIDTVGYYVGGMKQHELKESESKNILLGTYTMSSEGMDIPDLNAIIFASPKSDIIQSIGRILRKQHETSPIAWDIVDNFSPFSKQYIKRRTYYRKLKYSINIFNIQDSPIMSFDDCIKQLDNEPIKDSKKTRKKKINKSNEIIQDFTFIKDI